MSSYPKQKATIEALRERRVFNPVLLAKTTGATWIGYRTQDLGRGGHSAAYQIINPTRQTDPNAHWQDYGKKTILLFGRNKGGALADAKAFYEEWTGETVDDWCRFTFLGETWWPRHVLDECIEKALAGEEE